MDTVAQRGTTGSSTEILNRTGMEIIIDLPFGFPINNIISLGQGPL